jgi:GTP cyclohydrolase II
MKIAPDRFQSIARAQSELMIGMPVILENEGARVMMTAVETCSSALFETLRAGKDTHLSITARRAEVLKAMVYDGDLARIALPDEAGFAWIRAMADPSLDMNTPMKGPFRCLREGDASFDRAALILCKQARLLPAALISPAPDDASGLVVLDIGKDGFSTPTELSRIANAHVPLELAKSCNVHVFGHGHDFEQHYAIEIGQPDRSAPVLCRLHSACFTGDVLGSLKCDCGAQLKAGLQKISENGSGVLLYLNQEGRGIGLANKLRAYTLQAQGFDTVEANHRLGFEDDERDLKIGAHILRAMGFSQTNLMTNNPAKVDRMQDAGITVASRVPHQYGRHDHNTRYLDTKARKSGHIL